MNLRPERPRPYPVWFGLAVTAIFVSPNLIVLVTGPPKLGSSSELTNSQLTVSLAFTLALQLVLFVVAMLPLLLAGRLDGRLFGPSPARWSPRMVAVGLMSGVAATVGSYAINVFLVGLVAAREPVQQQLLQDALVGGAPLLLAVAIAVVVAPITEELVFRGVLFRSLADRFGGWLGILGSASIFSLVHIEVLYTQPIALAGLFVIGSVLAWSYHRTSSLLVPIVGHAVFNATSIGFALLLDRFAGLGT